MTITDMRIVFFIESLKLAGAERVVLELARASSIEGCEAEVVTLRDSQGPGRDLLEGVNVSPLFEQGKFRWPASALPAAMRLRGILKDIQPDVLAIHTPKAALIAAAAGIKVPTLWVLHGHDICWDGAPSRRRRSRSLQRWTRRKLKAHVAAVSSSLADHAAVGLGMSRKRITVIPNGVDTNRFQFQERTPVDDVVVCFLGRLIPGKGPLQAVEAFELLKKQLPAARLWFIGDGPMRRQLAAEVSTRGLSESVTFWGMLQRPEARLREAHILWMPSQSEGLPVACVEAMASGIPVVGYNVRGVRDLLQDGVGIMTDPKDARGLAAQTVLLVRDGEKYRTIARRARSLVEKEYSLQGMCTRHYALMRTLQDSGSVGSTVSEAAVDEISLRDDRK